MWLNFPSQRPLLALTAGMYLVFGLGQTLLTRNMVRKAQRNRRSE
jgi:hypothetical protein